MQAYDRLLKLLIIGSKKTGKSTIMSILTNNPIEPNHILTIGLQFKTKVYNIMNKKIKCQLWESSNFQKFKSITKTLFKGAEAILLVYDINNRNSFEKMLELYKESLLIIENRDNVEFLVIGNKNDLERKVGRDEGEEFAESNGFEFFEMSCENDFIVLDHRFRDFLMKF